MDIDALRGWFLSTVTGVVLLGVIGSIIGGLLLAALFWSFRALNARIREMMIAVVYRFVAREGAIIIQLRQQHDKEVEASAYLLTVITKALGAVIDTVILVAVLACTAAVAVVYGLDRPRLLSSAVSASLISLWMWIKALVTVGILTQSSVTATEQHLQATLPKSLRRFIKSGATSLVDTVRRAAARDDTVGK